MTKNEQLLFRNKCIKNIVKCLASAAESKTLRDIHEYVLVARLTLKYLHEMTDFAYIEVMSLLDDILKMTKQN